MAVFDPAAGTPPPQMPDHNWTLEELEAHLQGQLLGLQNYAISHRPKAEYEATVRATQAMLDGKRAVLATEEGRSADRTSWRQLWVNSAIGVAGIVLGAVLTRWLTPC